MTGADPERPDVPTDVLDAVSAMVIRGDRRRAARADTAWATLRPYERRILREAAVMGYVLGYQAGNLDGRTGIPADGRAIPGDEDIVRQVVEHCDSYDSGYHYLTDACAGFRRKVTRKRAYPGELAPMDPTRTARNRCYRSGLHGGGLHLPECPDATPDATP